LDSLPKEEPKPLTTSGLKSGGGGSGGEGGDQKPRIDVVEDKEDESNDHQVKIAMPFSLKKQLVEDWERTTR